MSTVSLTIGGTEYIDSVVIASARFESMVNGSVGLATFRIRDDLRTLAFTQGAVIVLTIDSVVTWRGFLSSSNRTYMFPVVDTDPAAGGLARFWDIEASDINVLMQRRFVFNQADGTTPAPEFPAGTADTVALTELFADWLDLTGDGINTTTLVENVGDLDPAEVSTPFAPGDTWARAVRTISALPGAIDYIDPDKNYVHTDVDTPNAPFDLSDQPDYVTTFGYREMEVLKDGASLVNDALEWGIGYGSMTPVFTREIDATSLATHGRWQAGALHSGVYKQASIDRIAESLVYGSPQNKRGSKDDKVAVIVTTFQPGLRVAQKVDFTSAAFGFNDVIPIRKMEITFVNSTTPKYKLTLSHDIDAPFDFVDPYLYRIPKRKVPIIKLPDPKCMGCLVGVVIDDFERTESGTWGTSTEGSVWQPNGIGGAYDVASGRGTVGLGGGAGDTSQTDLFPVLQTSPMFDITFLDIEVDLIAGPSYQMDVEFTTFATGLGFSVSGPWSGQTRLGLEVSGAADDIDIGTIIGDPINIRVRMPTGEAYAELRWWRVGDPEPTDWQIHISDPTPNLRVPDRIRIQTFIPNDVTDATLWSIGWIGTTYDRCAAVQFDDFERTVAGGWGTATGGQTWSEVGTGPGASVSGGAGIITADTGDGTLMTATPPMAGAFTMTSEFWVSTIPSTGNNSLVVSYDLEGGKLAYMEISSVPGVGAIYLGSGTPVEIAKIDWTTGHYLTKLSWDGSTVRFKVWLTTESEPDWMLSKAEAGAIGDLTVDFENFGAGTGRTVSFEYIDFDYSGRPCYCVGEDCVSPTAMPASPSGFGCELATRISAVNYQTSRPYQKGSLIVYVDGSLQERGVAWTESATNDQLFFFDTGIVDAGSVVFACYVPFG